MSIKKIKKKDMEASINLEIDIKNTIVIEIPKVTSCWCCHAPRWARCHDCNDHK